MDANGNDFPDGPKRYRVIVRGALSDRFASAFEDMTLEPTNGSGTTALVGDIRDQAQLYGLLDRVRDFGLELVAVEVVTPS